MNSLSVSPMVASKRPNRSTLKRLALAGASLAITAGSAFATDPTTAAGEMVTSAITELGNRATQVGQLGVALIAIAAVLGVIGIVIGFLKRK